LLPVAMYFDRHFGAAGGLISYGPDQIDMYRRATGYADRIPERGPISRYRHRQYELAINFKTGKTLGLAVPQTPLASADEVIEVAFLFAASLLTAEGGT
jgi:putative ABC transport system substrate-binding protein